MLRDFINLPSHQLSFCQQPFHQLVGKDCHFVNSQLKHSWNLSKTDLVQLKFVKAKYVMTNTHK